MKLSVDVLPHSHRSSSAAHVPAMPGIVHGRKRLESCASRRFLKNLRGIRSERTDNRHSESAPCGASSSCDGDAWNSPLDRDLRSGCACPGCAFCADDTSDPDALVCKHPKHRIICICLDPCMGLLYLEISSMDCSAPAQSMFFLSWSPTTSIGCFASAFLMELK